MLEKTAYAEPPPPTLLRDLFFQPASSEKNRSSEVKILERMSISKAAHYVQKPLRLFHAHTFKNFSGKTVG